MQFTDQPEKPGRRNFLKTLGLVSGGLAVSGAMPAAAAMRPRSSTRIGVLLPQSGIYPWLRESFSAGLRAGIHPAGAELIVEDTGVHPGRVTEKCGRLVREIGVDLVAALANIGAADDLNPLLSEARMPLILATSGADVERGRIPSNILVKSLDCWQSHWALGVWCARSIGGRAMTAASMRDSGYDAHYAFQMGFESAGGEVVAACVTDAPFYPGGVHAFLSDAARLKPDVVFANYSGYDAIPFMKTWSQYGQASGAALVGSSFFADENVLPLLGVDALGLLSVSPWAPELPPVSGAESADDHRKTRRSPDVFFSLGHECGRSAAQWASSGRLDHAGESRFDRGDPLYLRKVTRSGNEIMTELDRVSESHERIAALRSGVRTGWINTYLSA